MVLPQAYYQDLSVTIELLDQNDNAPRFQQEVINVEMFENSRAAHSLDNQMAYDPDTGEFFLKNFFRLTFFWSHEIWDFDILMM